MFLSKIIQRIPTKHKPYLYTAFGLCIVVIVLASIVLIRNVVQKNTQAKEEEQALVYSSRPLYTVTFKNVKDEDFIASESGKMIRINLETKVLTLYENGVPQDTFSILDAPQIGSYWETPGGTYRVSYKEEDHESYTTNARIPYSVQFFANSFTHGEPVQMNGKKYSKIPSVGIRLDNNDAKKIYEFSDLDTLVSVYSTSTKRPQQVHDFSSYYLKEAKKELDLSSESYLIGDVDTGEIIIEKNKEAIFPIASVSKLITALAVTKSGKEGKTATVSARAVSTLGTTGGLRSGEKIELQTLLYPLLLESSNDAAEAIADYFGRNTFIQEMNTIAKSIDMQKTSFDNPSGLSNNNTSTALDLFKLIRYLQKYESTIVEITALKNYKTKNHSWYNINKLTATPGFAGGKTGFINASKKTSVTLFKIPVSEFESRTLAFVVLRSDDRVKDHKNLLSYVKNNVYYGEHNPLLAERIAPYISPKPLEEIRMAFVGDMMLARGVKQSVLKNFKGDYGALFSNLEFLKTYDTVFANLEGPLSDIGTPRQGPYVFRMDINALTAIKNAGFNVLSLANNHINDYGRSAFEDTIKRLTDANILPVGAGINKEDAEKPKIIEKNGMRIGYLGFTDVGPNELAATSTTSGILLANDPRFEDIIRIASQDVDALVVSIHFGEEYKPHTAHQEALSKLAIDSGAKIVIGHHPHVAQDIEQYEDGVIIYSLGNFIFDQYFSKETMQGLFAGITLNKTGEMSIDTKTIKLNAQFKPDTVIDLKDPVLSQHAQQKSSL